MPDYTIRALETHNDYHLAEEAQRVIWDMTDELAVVPLHVLITAQKNGGLVAGAFDDNGRMAGMLFGFAGISASGRIKHCSHLMGVLPELRRTKLGEALKRYQREYVLALGVDLITWTFDPLEGVNANLNIGKLRAVARTYYPNLYETMLDTLNGGIPTDRFEVEWWVAHPRVTAPNNARADIEALLADGALLINPAEYGGSHIPSPGAIHQIEADRPPRVILVEIPAVYQAIKQQSLELALMWRYHSRAIFQMLFALGFAVTDFISTSRAADRRNFYVLERAVPLLET